jgi:hypothetical protein
VFTLTESPFEQGYADGHNEIPALFLTPVTQMTNAEREYQMGFILGLESHCFNPVCDGCDYCGGYQYFDPMDDIPWGTPDSWIPDNPNEDGFRLSDFVELG